MTLVGASSGCGADLKLPRMGLRGTVHPTVSFTFLSPFSFGVDSVYTMAYIVNMRFEWDENKNRSNYRKRGVWFEEAQTIWADSKSVEFLTRSTVPMRIVSFESGIRREVEFFSLYFARGRRDQRFALSLLEKQQRKK